MIVSLIGGFIGAALFLAFRWWFINVFAPHMAATRRRRYLYERD